MHKLLKQSWNLPAIKTTLYTLPRNPRLFFPKKVLKDISEADWGQLKFEMNIKYVIFDKDNTLTAPYVDHLHPKVEKSIAECKNIFGSEHIAIVSNSAGTPDDIELKWMSKIEEATGIPVIVHDKKKPLIPFREIELHFGELLEPSRVLMVGDRLLTDTVFGNLCGMQTLHCLVPLTSKGDNPIARIVRTIENKILGHWLKRH